MNFVASHRRSVLIAYSVARSLLAIAKNELGKELSHAEQCDVAVVNSTYVTKSSVGGAKISAENPPVPHGCITGVVGVLNEFPSPPAEESPDNYAMLNRLDHHFESRTLKAIAQRICVPMARFLGTIVAEDHVPSKDQLAALVVRTMNDPTPHTATAPRISLGGEDSDDDVPHPPPEV